MHGLCNTLHPLFLKKKISWFILWREQDISQSRPNDMMV